MCAQTTLTPREGRRKHCRVEAADKGPYHKRFFPRNVIQRWYCQLNWTAEWWERTRTSSVVTRSFENPVRRRGCCKPWAIPRNWEVSVANSQETRREGFSRFLPRLTRECSAQTALPSWSNVRHTGVLSKQPAVSKQWLWVRHCASKVRVHRLICASQKPQW